MGRGWSEDQPAIDPVAAGEGALSSLALLVAAQRFDADVLHLHLASDKMPVIPEGEGAIYYLMLDGRPRKANLFYRGATRSKYFEGVLKAVLTDLQLK